MTPAVLNPRFIPHSTHQFCYIFTPIPISCTNSKNSSISLKTHCHWNTIGTLKTSSLSMNFSHSTHHFLQLLHCLQLAHYIAQLMISWIHLWDHVARLERYNKQIMACPPNGWQLQPHHPTHTTHLPHYYWLNQQKDKSISPNTQHIWIHKSRRTNPLQPWMSVLPNKGDMHISHPCQLLLHVAWTHCICINRHTKAIEVTVQVHLNQPWQGLF